MLQATFIRTNGYINLSFLYKQPQVRRMTLALLCLIKVTLCWVSMLAMSRFKQARPSFRLFRFTFYIFRLFVWFFFMVECLLSSGYIRNLPRQNFLNKFHTELNINRHLYFVLHQSDVAFLGWASGYHLAAFAHGLSVFPFLCIESECHSLPGAIPPVGFEAVRFTEANLSVLKTVSFLVSVCSPLLKLCSISRSSYQLKTLKYLMW